MNASDLILLALAVIPPVYFASVGWRFGATFEMRHLLMLLFGMIVGLRYWEPCAEKVSAAVTFDPRWVAMGVFVVLFVAGTLVAAVVVNLKATVFQSVTPNYPDRVLGVLCGLISGVVLGTGLFWLVTVAVPGKFDSATAVFRDGSRMLVGNVETVMGVALNSSGRTHYPEATMADPPVDGGSGPAPADGPTSRRGQIAWK